jgi:FKBP-type peptidyl-prolyl cis-trans isomerase FklB
MTWRRALSSFALLALGGVLGALAACDGERRVPAPQSEAPQTDAQRASYAIGLHLGLRLRRQGADVDPERVVQGVREGLAATNAEPTTATRNARALPAAERVPAPALSAAEVKNELEALALATRDHERRALEAERRANQIAGDAFLRANATRAGVITLPSGIQYRVLEPGDGPRPSLADRVTLEYEARLLDGAVIDSSKDRTAPVIVRLERTPEAFRQVVPRLQRGAQVEIHVPGELAPRDTPPAFADPGETVAFTLRLLAIDHQPPLRGVTDTL